MAWCPVVVAEAVEVGTVLEREMATVLGKVLVLVPGTALGMKKEMGMVTGMVEA